MEWLQETLLLIAAHLLIRLHLLAWMQEMLALSDEQLETRRRVQRAIVESHQRFYHEHLQADTARPLRPLVDAMFALQRRSAERVR